MVPEPWNWCDVVVEEEYQTKKKKIQNRVIDIDNDMSIEGMVRTHLTEEAT